MKRKAIKFSGDYPKLHGQTSAELIAVRDIRIDRDTPAELLTYDTTKSDGSRSCAGRFLDNFPNC